MEQTTTNSKKTRKNPLVIGLMGLVALLISCLIVVSFGYYKEKTRKLTAQEVQEVQDKEIEILLDQVKQHILLPEDQEPSVATIMDAQALKNDSLFFQKAEDGFKVIIYSDRAILFDPTKNIIINVGPVQLQQPIEELQSETEQLQPTETKTGEDAEEEIEKREDENLKQ